MLFLVHKNRHITTYQKVGFSFYLAVYLIIYTNRKFMEC